MDTWGHYEEVRDCKDYDADINELNIAKGRSFTRANIGRYSRARCYCGPQTAWNVDSFTHTLLCRNLLDLRAPLRSLFGSLSLPLARVLACSLEIVRESEICESLSLYIHYTVGPGCFVPIGTSAFWLLFWKFVIMKYYWKGLIGT